LKKIFQTIDGCSLKTSFAIERQYLKTKLIKPLNCLKKSSKPFNASMC